MAILTIKAVEAAKPDPSGTKDTYLYDDDVKGFGLRIRPSGAKTFILQYRVHGGRKAQGRRLTIGKLGSPWTPTTARARAEELLRDYVSRGIDPMGAKTDARNAPTVGALVEIYLTKGLAAKPDKKVSSWKTDESNLRRHVIPLLGKKKARDVIKADIEHFRRDVTNGKTIAEEKTKSRGRAIVRGGAGTALRSAAVLSAMLKWAFEQELIPHNPSVGINLSRQKLSRQKFLSAGEIYSLAQSLDKLEHTGVNATPLEAIRVLLFTGARRNEILNLKWEYLDLDEGRINLPDSKTGAKSIPLGAPALEVLARQPRNDVSPWVFPSRRGGGPYVGLRKVFLQACKLAKLKNVRIHDLRHSFASFAVAGGATLFVTGKILGHKQARATEVYAHLDDDPLKAAANRISKRIAAATRNQPKKNVVAIGRSN